MTQIQALETMSQTDLVKLIETERQQHADDMDMLAKELASRAAPIELRVVADILAEGNGCWATCSGCHESNDGYPTGPYSQVMKCTLGVGCRECGGIGAIWDTTNYAEMGDAMAAAMREDNSPIVTATHQASTLMESLTPDTQCTCPSGNGSLRWPCPVHPPESVNLTKSSNQQVDPRIIIQSLSMTIKLIAKAAKSDGLQLASRTHHKVNDALSLLERYELLGSPLRTNEE
ncbi:hypothetical protein [Paenalcaligenes suwonensis]|uniref:hypothetical protein n=1 Tax=Paenalcaligenes suwonensis TaxID=1202713 RepID=UPI00140A03F9|nr:hypothetical protein [Paenalcaligenes suwonensis]NHC62740.1 hypothetical protein [Paenalcaligenes suwonensis]